MRGWDERRFVGATVVFCQVRIMGGDDSGLIGVFLGGSMSQTGENLPDFVRLANAVGLLGAISGDALLISRSWRTQLDCCGRYRAALTGFCGFGDRARRFHSIPNSSRTAGRSGQNRGRRG